VATVRIDVTLLFSWLTASLLLRPGFQAPGRW